MESMSKIDQWMMTLNTGDVDKDIGHWSNAFIPSSPLLPDESSVAGYLNDKPSYCGALLPTVPEFAQKGISLPIRCEEKEKREKSSPTTSLFPIHSEGFQDTKQPKQTKPIVPTLPAQQVTSAQFNLTVDHQQLLRNHPTLKHNSRYGAISHLHQKQKKLGKQNHQLSQDNLNTAHADAAKFPRQGQKTTGSPVRIPSNNWTRNKQFIKSIPDGYECLICHKTFGRYNSVSYHVTMYHRKPPITCGESGCDFSTRESRYVHFHRFYRHGIPLPPRIDISSRGCSFCGLIAKSPTMLNKHYQKHTGLIRQRVKNIGMGAAVVAHFECPECPKLFESAKSVLRHMVQAHAKTASDLLKGSTALGRMGGSTAISDILNMHHHTALGAAANRESKLNKSFRKAKITLMTTTAPSSTTVKENDHHFTCQSRIISPPMKRQFEAALNDREFPVSKKVNHNFHPYGTNALQPQQPFDIESCSSLHENIHRQQEILLESARIHSAFRLKTSLMMKGGLFQDHQQERIGEKRAEFGALSPTNSSLSLSSTEISDV